MKNIEMLIENICNAEYEYKDYNGKREKGIVVSRYSSYLTEERAAIARAVYEWACEQMDDMEQSREIAMLEAKCYAYEKIIANSNFAPMLVKEVDDEGNS